MTAKKRERKPVQQLSDEDETEENSRKKVRWEGNDSDAADEPSDDESSDDSSPKVRFFCYSIRF